MAAGNTVAPSSVFHLHFVTVKPSHDFLLKKKKKTAPLLTISALWRNSAPNRHRCKHQTWNCFLLLLHQVFTSTNCKQGHIFFCSSLRMVFLFIFFGSGQSCYWQNKCWPESHFCYILSYLMGGGAMANLRDVFGSNFSKPTSKLLMNRGDLTSLSSLNIKLIRPHLKNIFPLDALWRH